MNKDPKILLVISWLILLISFGTLAVQYAGIKSDLAMCWDEHPMGGN